MRSSLLVLNFNGCGLLEDCFSALGRATQDGLQHNVYLVDNCSTDNSIAYTERKFPWVKVVCASRNAFLFTYNDIVTRLDTEAVLLLNNDIFVEPDFIQPLLQHLAAPDVFAINARVLTGDRMTSQGSRTSGGVNRGLWWYHQLRDIDRASSCFFALGGQAAFSRSKFMELGGFDELFWPLYHEDIDLSYRAWRRGWRVLYEPASVIYHLGAQTSAAKYKQDQMREIVTQNTFLFQWKNIDDPRMRAEHRAWLGPRLMRALVRRDAPFFRGFQAALGRRQRAADQRAADRPQRLISDRQAFQRIMAGIDGNIDAAIA